MSQSWLGAVVHLNGSVKSIRSYTWITMKRSDTGIWRHTRNRKRPSSTSTKGSLSSSHSVLTDESFTLFDSTRLDWLSFPVCCTGGTPSSSAPLALLASHSGVRRASWVENTSRWPWVAVVGRWSLTYIWHRCDLRHNSPTRTLIIINHNPFLYATIARICNANFTSSQTAAKWIHNCPWNVRIVKSFLWTRFFSLFLIRWFSIFW